MVGACVDIKSDLLCPGGVDLPGPSGVATTSGNTTAMAAVASSGNAISGTVLYVIIGVSGFCLVLIAVAIAACVVMRRRKTGGWNPLGRKQFNEDQVSLVTMGTRAAASNGVL